MTTNSTTYGSPLGPLTLSCTGCRLTGLRFRGQVGPRAEGAVRVATLVEAARQLAQYFAGEREGFELELESGGTPFQRDVWEALLRVPYGTTVSYTELAGTVGMPDRVRAVAGAVARTPVPIFVPCHRVVAADGALTGYRGGLQRKQALVDLERRAAANLPPEPAWTFRQLAMV